MQIQLLPEHIIDQIKAGEVIERPSTLIKEILENAIDAGATKLDLHLIDNGLELISLQDNGVGIDAKELPLAFCRHATSKIDRFEDIYRLKSYGFRGEALASIASVSKVSCESVTTSNFGKITIEGGETLSHYEEQRVHNDTGTKIFIKDLFFNTPVRMKFIQSKTSEKNQIKKILQAFLLEHYDKDFSIKWDQNEKDIYPARTEQKKRIQDVLFSKQDIELRFLETTYDGVHVKIFLSEESSRGNAHKSHFIFVNQRYVREMAIHKVILNTASSLWPEGETGHYVCMISLPSDELDVNVHPNKTVVKFFRLGKILSVISGSIKSHLAPEKFSKRHETISTNHQPSLLSDEEQSQSREVKYNSIDFSSPSESENYLKNIHYKGIPAEVTEDSFRILHKTQQHFLFTFNQTLYLGSLETLVNFYIRNLLSEVDREQTSPLLVSRPLEFGKKLSDQELNKIEKFGFELDALDGLTYAVRSFYTPLQIFPYLTILNLLVKSHFKIETINFFKELETYNPSTLALQDLLSQVNLLTLISQGLVKPLDSHQLKRWYEN